MATTFYTYSGDFQFHGSDEITCYKCVTPTKDICPSAKLQRYPYTILYTNCRLIYNAFFVILFKPSHTTRSTKWPQEKSLKKTRSRATSSSLASIRAGNVRETHLVQLEESESGRRPRTIQFVGRGASVSGGPWRDSQRGTQATLEN